MRLLIDEMYPPACAQQLRARGHDAEAVTERDELRALADAELLAQAQQEHRALATENIADFCVIADRYDERGSPHHGLVLLNPRRYRRGHPRTVGRVVTALADLLDAHRAIAPNSARQWL